MTLPPAHASFAWRETPYGPALVCLPLASLATHLFTSRSWRLGREAGSGPEAWDELAAATGVAPGAVNRLRQVHGATVVRVYEQEGAAGQPPLPEGDVLVSETPGAVLAVQGADCVPLLLADTRRGIVAAAHSGWRGMVLDVAGRTVAAMREQFGTHPEDVLAAVGPAVGGCCYEVGPEVRQAFVVAGQQAGAIDRWFTPAARADAGNPRMPGVPSLARPGHFFLDGWRVVREQLEAAGVPPSQVHVAGLCTASHPAVFCSYRRDGSRAGRIAAAIRTPGA